MLKYIFLILIFIHGLIHLMGFVEAFKLTKNELLTLKISRFAGIVWLIATILFITSGIFFIVKVENWFILLIVSCIISQVLILTYWKDAKFGTIANVLILLLIILHSNFDYTL